MLENKTRAIFCLLLAIPVVDVPTTNRYMNFPNSICAKEIHNKTQQDRLLVEVMLKLEGKTVPGQPKVVSAKNTADALHEKTSRSPLDLKQTSEQTWTCYAEEGQEYVIGWIAKKGWFAKKTRMFGYCSEPFTAKEGLTVEFSPGMPSTFEYDLRNPLKGVVAAPAEVFLLREIVKNEERTFLYWMGGKQEIKKKGILKISGLAAGAYKISARLKNEGRHRKSRTPILYEDREIEILAGKTNRFTPVYPEIDSTVEEGDAMIRGTLYGPDKKPLANKTIHVIPLAKNGFDLSLYYPESTTDSNGRFEFVGIRPNTLVYVSHENTSINLGKQSLAANTSVSVDIVLGLKKLPVVIGEPLQEIFIDWKAGNTGKLSELQGKTVVLDVWATWCAPCIKALPKLNSLAANFSNDSNLVFVALSIDDDQAVWKKVVNESNWNAFTHGWMDKKKNSFAFHRPIPYSMIIDKNGVVRAEGNGIDIKLELDKLSKTQTSPALSLTNDRSVNKKDAEQQI